MKILITSIKISFLLSVSGLIIAIGTPYFLPMIQEIKADSEKRDVATYRFSNENKALLEEFTDLSQSQATVSIPQTNTLFIPKISVSTQILEHSDISVLDMSEGVWHDPITKTPPVKGNTVIAGHRFQYLPPNASTLYNLDKIHQGDVIIIFWKGKDYIYQVSETRIVADNDTSILKDIQGRNTVTLYTCTIPDSDKRLVVIADLKTKS